jgi:hypothetical protein
MFVTAALHDSEIEITIRSERIERYGTDGTYHSPSAVAGSFSLIPSFAVSGGGAIVVQGNGRHTYRYRLPVLKWQRVKTGFDADPVSNLVRHCEKR